jgi:hypothetical protein
MSRYAHKGVSTARYHAPKKCRDCGRMMPFKLTGGSANPGAVCHHCKEAARLARRAAEADKAQT